MKKVIIVLGVLAIASTLLSCSNDSMNVDEGCNCEMKGYVGGELKNTYFYSNDCNDDGKIITKNGSYIVKVECK